MRSTPLASTGPITSSSTRASRSSAPTRWTHPTGSLRAWMLRDAEGQRNGLSLPAQAAPLANLGVPPVFRTPARVPPLGFELFVTALRDSHDECDCRREARRRGDGSLQSRRDPLGRGLGPIARSDDRRYKAR